MSRRPCQKSFTNIYHIMIRGNEKKDIFIDDEDRYKFLEVISKKMELSGYDIYAYCLMNNHIHLLMKENIEGIDLCFKRINVSYVYYFNKKYNRVGHLFQDRFKSECIDTEQYLLSAVRYIHNNPVKEGIAMHPCDYTWSSYNAYITNTQYALVDKYKILNQFSHSTKKACRLFAEFSNEKNEDSFIDYNENRKNDCISIRGSAEALSYIDKYISDNKIKHEELLDKRNVSLRDELICFLKMNSNLSIKEISEILRLNRGVVQRAKMC